ncbi:hypothetical protein GCM10010246_17270 [Streptomyces cuspidosporus]|uniref:Uncharacterized protein n=1 Tax=Streptomyces cuspidosporus TaxID=66882 RepID=A0ABN3FNC7_9ACTN
MKTVAAYSAQKAASPAAPSHGRGISPCKRSLTPPVSMNNQGRKAAGPGGLRRAMREVAESSAVLAGMVRGYGSHR